MAYQAPGVLDSNSRVDPERARTEVLAQAFKDAAGGYFDRLAQYEDTIEEAEDEKERMKYYGIGAGVLGLVIAIGGLAMVEGSGGPIAAVIGLIVGAGGGYYAYTQYTEAEERIESNRASIEQNEPDGTVTFVSQVAVPMYLVPYADRHMIFDGLNSAPETTLDLANLDGDALANRMAKLQEVKSVYDEELTGETVLSPEFVQQFSMNLTEHRQLEKPLLDRIDLMTEVASDLERERISVNVHANNRKSRSIRELASKDLLEHDGSLSEIETAQSQAASEAVVTEIRGVEEQAVSGDLLTQAQNQRDSVESITSELAERLQENRTRVTDHYQDYSETVETTLGKHVCTTCLNERVQTVSDELNLVDQILSSEAGSLGTALSDEDLNKGIDEPFTQNVREEIQERIPELTGEFRRAFNSLPDLGPGTAYCETHGEVETVYVEDSGAVFGEVWRALYYRFREPIMDSVDDLERDAEEIRQNKEQRMVDLTQYEQIKDEVEQRYHSVRTDYEAAQMVEKELR